MVIRRGATAVVAVMLLAAGAVPTVIRQAPALRLQAAVARFERSAHAYERSKTALLVALERTGRELDSESVEQVRRDLEVVDRTIERSRAALGRGADVRLARTLAGQAEDLLGVVEGTQRTLEGRP